MPIRLSFRPPRPAARWGSFSRLPRRLLHLPRHRRDDLVVRPGEGLALHLEAGRTGVAAAAEFFGEAGDVDLTLAAEADSDGAEVAGLCEEEGDFDGGDLEGDVDQVLGVGDVGAGLLEVLDG